jgi:glutamate synthase (NADPH/NADH) small chain
MELIEERNYCLNCKNKPCSAFGCPLENDIPGFIKANDDKTAFEILCKTTVLPAICGRICPKSRYCQANCIRGIRQEPVEIGKIETCIGDISIKNNYKIPKESSKLKNKKVAVVGSGPAGLTCAAFLAMKGIQVTIYEKNKKLGGILQYGIPSFRLDKKIVDETINKILELGIKTKTNQELGKDFNIDQLAKEYDAVFISIGTNKQRTILEGRNILSANLLLENIQNNKSFPDFKNKNVLIYGGGNVAIDAARTIKRLGANVSIVYRRNIEQMPAEISEIKDAQNEGIKTIEKTNIIKFKNGKASCIQTRLVEKNDNIEEKLKHKNPIEQKNIKRNNTKVENIEGTNYEIDADYIILAIGSLADVELLKKQGIKIDEHGFIQVDEYNRTSIKKVFAGGDIIGKEATVAYAARSGRETANYITQLLQKNNMDVT